MRADKSKEKKIPLNTNEEILADILRLCEHCGVQVQFLSPGLARRKF